MADLHDLVAAYAVDALDSPERRRFEAHLADCNRCRRELASLEPAVVGLAEGVSVDPPAGMRAAVLETVAGTPQETDPDGRSDPATRRGEDVLDLTVHRRRRRGRWTVAIGAAAVLITAIGYASLFGAGPTLEEISAAPDSAAVVLDGQIGAARFVYSDSLDAGVFISTTLPPVGQDETYQLWLIDEGGPRSAGIFRPADDGSVEFIVEAAIASGQTLGMTIEPAGGSPTPTGEVLLAQELG